MTFINNHHAYLVVGNKQDLLPRVLKLAEDISGVTEVIHPDKMVWDISSWSVDDSRAIKEWQSRRPVGKAKCGIIVCESMTEAAGQALLKVLEEPAADVHFFVLVSKESILINTLHSRLARIADLSFTSKESINNALPAKFFSSLPADRLKEVADKAEIRALVEGLENFLFNNRLKIAPQVLDEANQVIKETKENLDNPRFPAKLALESLALLLPKVVL